MCGEETLTIVNPPKNIKFQHNVNDIPGKEFSTVLSKLLGFSTPDVSLKSLHLFGIVKHILDLLSLDISSRI